MTVIRPSLRLYVALVLLMGCAAFVGLAPRSLPDDLPLAVGLLVLATVAQLRPIHLTQKMKMTVEDTATFAAALLLVPWLALLVAGASVLLAATRQRRAPWFEAGFNAASSGLASFTAATVFVAMGGERADVAAYAPAAAAAGVTQYVVNTALVDIAVALQLRRNPLATWWRVHRRDLPQSTALFALGGLMAVVANAYPIAIVLFLVPLAAVFASMREAARLRAQTREAVLEFAKLIDLRDRYTHGHSQRVAELAERVARQLRFEQTQIELVREAALLHDLGKIRTADHVLQKPGPLDEHEHEEMRLHSEAGAELLRRLPDFWEGAALVRAHHERFDGKGYPRGLVGAEVPLEAAVIAVADAWDAMTSDRPYRRALAVADARAELQRHRGSQWSPDAVDALLAILGEQAHAVAPALSVAPAAR